MDAVRRIAETVLYEGHVLWPYHRAALKNRERWTFGRMYPEGHHAAGDSCAVQLQALLEPGGAARMTLTLRFLQLVQRGLSRDGERVEALRAGGRDYVAWDEVVEREIVIEGAVGDPPCQRTFTVPAGRRDEELGAVEGAHTGAVVRTWRELQGAVTLATEPVAPSLSRITARATNTTAWTDPGKGLLGATFLSSHLVLTAPGGRFVSLQDPPPVWQSAAAACHNLGVWPVLVGEPGDRGTLLAAPIVLYDYPQIAPESPGDFFDATEIDQMLVLNVLALTDEERRQVAAADPRTREIVERCAALSVEDFMRLHGTLRDRRPLDEA